MPRGQGLCVGIFNPSVSCHHPPPNPGCGRTGGVLGRQLCRLLQREKEAHPFSQVPTGAKCHMDLGLSHMPGNAEPQCRRLWSGGVRASTPQGPWGQGLQ